MMRCLQPTCTEKALEGRKEVCHARDSQNWLVRVKSSALVTGFVLAEGTHQTGTHLERHDDDDDDDGDDERIVWGLAKTLSITS